MLTVAETEMFTKQAPKYWSNDEHAAFISFIASNPDAGAVVPTQAVFAKCAGV